MMTIKKNSIVVLAAVYLGAVILIALPVTMILSNAFVAALETLDSEWIVEGYGSLVVIGISGLIGLQLAVEATALQFDGIEALDRGSPRIALVRHVALAVGIFVALALATWYALTLFVGGHGAVIAALGALVALVAVLSLYRGLRTFVAGYRSDSV